MPFLAVSEAAADGEKTPMVGGALLWEPSPEKPSGAVGVELEAAWWFGPLGLAVEGSGRTWVESGPRALVLGGSVRLRVLETLVPSLLDASDVELGLELQGIVEHAWSERSSSEIEPTRHGLGFALRLRGSDDETSRLIVESRFFLRVLSARASNLDEIAMRTTTPPDVAREWTVVFGVGAAFGAGEPDYLERFRRRPFGWMP
ncbi:MAG: hypothetical protein JWP01_2385 [Myxococcales bacterium]|nr:hypothetical protein [Myxococcales bacterium]